MSLAHWEGVQAQAQRTEAQARRWRWAWRAALALQLLLLASVPLPKLSAYLLGMPGWLRVELADPYDPLRGSYLELSYPDLAWDRLSELPGSPGQATQDPGTPWWVLVEAGEGGYRPKSLHPDGPPPFDSSYQFVVQGHVRAGALRFGADRCHLEEAEAKRLEALLREHPHEGEATLRVDARGHVWLERVGLRPKPRFKAPPQAWGPWLAPPAPGAWAVPPG